MHPYTLASWIPYEGGYTAKYPYGDALHYIYIAKYKFEK